MKAIIATVLGLFSGFLVYMAVAYMAVAMVSAAGSKDPTGIATAFIAFPIAWVLSTWWMLRNAKGLSVVFRRGFLLGAAEWVAMIPMGFLSAAGSSVALRNGAAISNGEAAGLGIVGFVTGGFSIMMAFCCLVCFAVAYLMGRESESASPTRKCPMCAETIKAEAIRCKFCGAELPLAARPTQG